MERCDSWRVDFCQGGGDLPLNSRNEDALEVQQHGRDCQNNPNARGQLCERLPLVHILGILHSLECCLDAAQLFQRWMQKMLVEYLTKSSTNSQMCILCKFLRNIDKSFDFYLRVGIFFCMLNSADQNIPSMLVPPRQARPPLLPCLSNLSFLLIGLTTFLVMLSTFFFWFHLKPQPLQWTTKVWLLENINPSLAISNGHYFDSLFFSR